MTAADVTRGEFTMLAAQVAANSQGVQGVGVVQVQLTELAKDVAKLETKLERHEEDHAAERRERMSGRRWLIGIAVLLLGSIDGPVLAILFTRH